MKSFFFRNEYPRKQSAILQIQYDNDDDDDLSSSTSTVISFDTEFFPSNIIDHFDRIYTHRHHKRCIHYTYLTLLFLTLSVICWMIYWITYEFCEKSRDENVESFICHTVLIFQYSTIVFLCLSPIYFLLMIIFWTIFSCQNPIDKIRMNFIGFKLENQQWENQLDSYIEKSCCSKKQHKNYRQRNFGYIILSSNGIIFDEIFLLTSKTNLIRHALLINNGQILKLKLNHYSKRNLLIYLPNHLINRESMNEFERILKIKLNIDEILPVRF